MPITQGSVALTILQTADKKALNNVTLDSLRRHTIRSLEGADEKAIGFTPIVDPFDTDWNSHPEIGEFTAFCFRIDSKRIPGQVLKKHLQEALEKETAQNQKEGKAFISRARKKELKETVKIRLLAKAEAVPAAHEVVITPAGTVYLASSSNGIIKNFQDFFFQCFGYELTEVQQTFSIEDQDMASEFLTRIVKEGIFTDAADMDPDKQCSITATGQITVADTDKQISGTSRSDSDIQEIQTAIGSGMRVAKTGIRIDTGDAESCTLTFTPLLRVSGMKLPATQPQNDAEDPDALFLERMFLIQKYTDILLESFKAFLKEWA